MVVYLDILVFLNLFVNFFILKITTLIGHEQPKTIRLLLGSLVGAIFSLYIFLPPSSSLIEVLFRLAVSGVIILITFKFDSIKSFLRRIALFFGVSYLYAGFMLSLYNILNLKNLAINNSIVYFNISPLTLIILTLLCYLVISVIRFFAEKQALNGKRCKLLIEKEDMKAEITALVDTGHSLKDNITGKSVIIVEPYIAKKLFCNIPSLEDEELLQSPTLKGFRVIPYSSVGGKGLLIAFKPDKVWVFLEGKQCEITSPVVAISKEALGEDYKAIISPEIIKYS